MIKKYICGRSNEDFSRHPLFRKQEVLFGLKYTFIFSVFQIYVYRYTFRPATLLKRDSPTQVFSVNIVIFLEQPVFMEQLWWLLLCVRIYHFLGSQVAPLHMWSEINILLKFLIFFRKIKVTECTCKYNPKKIAVLLGAFL